MIEEDYRMKAYGKGIKAGLLFCKIMFAIIICLGIYMYINQK